MSRYRIKAYLINEKDESACRAAIDNATLGSPEWTEGYVIGVVDRQGLASLTRQGVMVSPIEEIVETSETGPLLSLLGGTSGLRVGLSQNPPLRSAASGLPLAMPAIDPLSKILSQDRAAAQFYVVRFHGPITPQRRADLDQMRIKLTARMSRNRYSVRLRPPQVAKLAALEFVDWLRIFTPQDRLRVTEPRTESLDAPAKRSAKSDVTFTSKAERKSARTARIESTPTNAALPNRTVLYSVRLHRRRDMPALTAWMKQHDCKPLWKGPDAVRLALRRDGSEVRALAKLPEVAIIEELRPAQLFDEHAVPLLGLPTMRHPSLNLTGQGEVVGIADTGLDITHPDFQGRILGTQSLGRPGDISDPEGHGTHVAGCVLGDGAASKGVVTGAAPKAQVYFQSILDTQGGLGGLPPDLGTLFTQAYARGARIHNNSWGTFSYARYSTMSLEVDRFIAKHPDMLIVIAAGNDGVANDRTTNAKPGFVDWPCVAAPATAKNGLTVGASRSDRTSGGFAQLTWGSAWSARYPRAPIAHATISGDPECLAAFSSRGPCDDARIKPDVVAPGTDVAAARSKDAPLRKFWGAYPNNARYGFMGGTSMAAPYVAGCAALVREWYRTRRQHPTPSAALIKATLINGARRLNGDDAIAEIKGEPNYHQGFGRIDMIQTLPNPASGALQLSFDDTWMHQGHALAESGARVRYTLNVKSGSPLRLCLVWTDPPARSLQNSLTLLVESADGQRFIGNANAAVLLKIPGTVEDPNNNVQVVRLDAPIAGSYTVMVVANNLLLPPQDFALVATGTLASQLMRRPGP